MSDCRGIPAGKNLSKFSGYVRFLVLLLLVLFLSITTSCDKNPVSTKEINTITASGSPRLRLWLAKKGELIEHESATFDLATPVFF